MLVQEFRYPFVRRPSVMSPLSLLLLLKEEEERESDSSVPLNSVG